MTFQTVLTVSAIARGNNTPSGNPRLTLSFEEEVQPLRTEDDTHASAYLAGLDPHASHRLRLTVSDDFRITEVENVGEVAAQALRALSDAQEDPDTTPSELERLTDEFEEARRRAEM